MEYVTPVSENPARSGRAERRPVTVPLTIAVVGIVAMVMIPAAIVMLLGYTTAQQNTLEMFRREVGAVMVEVSERIRGHLDPVGDQSRYLAEMISSGEVEPSQPGQLVPVLTGALAGLRQVGELAFIDPTGRLTRVQRRTRRYKRSDWSDDPGTLDMIAKARARKSGYWGEFFFAESSGVTLLNYRTPVWRDGRFLGVLVSVVSTRSLSDFLSRIVSKYPRNAFVLQGSDYVLAHPSMPTANLELSDSNPLPRLDQIGDPILAQIGVESGWRAALQNASTGIQSRTVSVGEVRHVVSYRRLDGYGEEPWIVGFSLPNSEIKGPVERIQLIVVVGMAILSVSVLGAYFLGRGLTRPIQELASAVGSVHDLDHHDATPGQAVGRTVFRELDAAAKSVNALLSGLYWFRTYVPRSLVARLIRDNVRSVASEEREVTVMFTDIYDFTGLAAHQSSHELVEFLNEHFTLLAGSVEEEGGTVDKYIGDSLMAFWGAPEHQPDHAERAFQAALEIASRIRQDNVRRQEAGLDPVRLRIGLHTGPAIVGNIGAPSRVNYTIIGDTVNVAQRIESLSKQLHEDTRDAVILISSTTIDGLGGGLQDFSVGSHVLPGRYGPIEIYRLS